MRVCYLLPSAKRGQLGWNTTENAVGNLKASKPWLAALTAEYGTLSEYWAAGNIALSFAQ